MTETFIQTVDLEIDGYQVKFRIAGMTEYYDVWDMISKASEKNPDIKAIREKIDELNASENKTEEELEALSIKVDELNEIMVGGDTHLRRFIIDHTLDISKNGESGGEQKARWFVDTQPTATLVELVEKIKPDLEKNLQSQS